MNPTLGPTATPRRAPTKPAGWVYLIHTWDDDRKYGGQTSQPPWRRIQRHRNTQRWGSQIMPGRDGYTILRRVDSCGDPARDAILLDLAEAEEIDKWQPTENVLRPDPQLFRRRLAAYDAGLIVGFSPTNPTRLPGLGAPTASWGSTAVGRPRRSPRRIPWGSIRFAVLSVLSVIVVWRLGAPWANPRAPWVVLPMAALLGPVAIVGLARKVTQPPRRRRSRRRRGTRRWR